MHIIVNHYAEDILNLISEAVSLDPAVTEYEIDQKGELTTILTTDLKIFSLSPTRSMRRIRALFKRL